MFYWNIVMKMLKCKKRKFDDVTLQYSIEEGREFMPDRYNFWVVSSAIAFNTDEVQEY